MKQDLETFYIIALILAKIFFRGIYLAEFNLQMQQNSD